MLLWDPLRNEAMDTGATVGVLLEMRPWILVLLWDPLRNEAMDTGATMETS